MGIEMDMSGSDGVSCILSTGGRKTTNIYVPHQEAFTQRRATVMVQYFQCWTVSASPWANGTISYQEYISMHMDTNSLQLLDTYGCHIG